MRGLERSGPFDIAPKAILKVLVSIGLVFLTIKIYKIALLIFLGFLLAVSLEPITQFLQSHKMRRSFAIALITFAMSALVVLVGIFLVPSIFNQVSALIKAIPYLKQAVLNHTPGEGPFKTALYQMLNNPKVPDSSVLMASAVSFLNLAFEGITEFFLVLIFSIYLLIDGKRAFKWICDFFAAPTRLKLMATAKETSVVIHRYVMIQVVTSLSSGIYTFTVLTILKVPGALTLGALAGILDILPILGFFIAVVPAVLLAVTISPLTGVLVLGLYLLYHSIENYLIVPMVYGNQMKVSSLVVLIASLVAGSLSGILGAIAILPVVASYPIIERIWLVKYLGRQIVSKHADRTELETLPEQVKMWNEKPPRLDRATARPLSSLPEKKVLIVDDDEDIRSLLKDILETEGYEGLVASNGREGLEVLYHHDNIGLILLDMMMPVMDGRTFLDSIKSVEGLSKIPVVFLSASADASNSAGAVRVLKKPTEIDLVLDIVDQHYSANTLFN